jgi:hypothetical protein
MIGGGIKSTQYSSGTTTSWSVGPTPSATITHQTNIEDFDPSQIGTFCATTGQLADV